MPPVVARCNIRPTMCEAVSDHGATAHGAEESDGARDLGWADATTALHGVGPAVAGHLERAGIRTVGDLLGRFPRRHREIDELDEPDAASVGRRVRLRATPVGARRRWLPGRRVMVTVDFDTAGGGRVELTFFNQPWMDKAFEVGRERQIEGVLETTRRGFALADPRVVARSRDARGECEVRYASIEGVSEERLRSLIGQALDRLRIATVPQERLPEGVATFDMAPVERLEAMHRPTDVARHEAAREHFAVLEAARLFRRVERLRRRRAARPAPRIVAGPSHDARVRRVLPFAWTAEQDAAVRELRARLAGADGPMGVLLQGDVGTGKTAVALDAALAAIDAGFQVAFCAPTALLAEQHAAKLGAWLADDPVRTGLLTAALDTGERRLLEAAVAAGDVDLVFGTHALFSARTRFARLGLVIVDEQHRFGVEQRQALFRKGDHPHVLVMTATPIPRSLTWTLFGDLDPIVLRERPASRAAVPAIHVPRSDWPRVLRTIGDHARRGGRAYVVCPKIGADGERGGAVRMHRELRDRFRAGLVHGRMPVDERRAVTDAFRAGELDVLVGTTVLEVGVDVAAATLMVVVGAENFGIATLHQLRGRVGRGARRGVCLLAGDENARVAAVRRTTSGLDLAEEDLALRGAGEFLGARQSGAGDFRALDPLVDRDLLGQVRAAVRAEPLDASDADPDC